MAYDAVLTAGSKGPVAKLLGPSFAVDTFLSWCRELPNDEEHFAVKELGDTMSYPDSEALAVQLEDVIKSDKPEKPIRQVAESLLEVIDGGYENEKVTISEDADDVIAREKEK